MPRPIGWKPLSYTKLAEVCACVIRGDPRKSICRQYGTNLTTLMDIRRTLNLMGVSTADRATIIDPAKSDKIWRLLRTTSLRDCQINRAVGGCDKQSVRNRRAAHYRQLAASGLPVPKCECGDVFEHPSHCSYWALGKTTRSEEGLSDEERDAIMAEIADGAGCATIRQRWNIAVAAFESLRSRLSKAQHRKRPSNTARRRHLELRKRKAQGSADGLFERIDRSLSPRIDPAVRDDVRQMLIVEVLSGAMTEKEAVSRQREFVTKAYTLEGSRWTTVPLGGSAEGLSLEERIADESALAAFDQVEF